MTWLRVPENLYIPDCGWGFDAEKLTEAMCEKKKEPTGRLVSHCCGAPPISNGDCDSTDFGLCPECHDHCEFVPEEE